jgi:uncharacterized membrane protein
MSDLIVTGYPDEDTAQRVYDELMKLEHDIIVRKVTMDRFLEALRPYGGTVLQTSLPRDAEQELMEGLHGSDPGAPTWEQPSATAGATS